MAMLSKQMEASLQAQFFQTSMLFNGWEVRLNDTFRVGAVTLDPNHQSVVMSSATWSALVSEVQRGGSTPTLAELERVQEQVRVTMRTQMVDLSVKSPRKVVDRRRVTRYSDDRVDYICRGISDLVAQMSNLMGMPGRSEGSVAEAAKRYAELAHEMKALRSAVLMAEGKFEIAQQQVMQLMGEA